MFKLYIFDEVNQDYTSQTNRIIQVIRKYKQDYQNWLDENKKFVDEASLKTGWSVQQVLDFLGKDLPNVSYVSASPNMTFDKGSLQSFSQSEFNYILDNIKVPKVVKYLKDETFGKLYRLIQGATWRYNNVFIDTSTGKSVDIKVTVKRINGDNSNKYGLPLMFSVGEKYIGTNVAGADSVNYSLNFFEHGTNKEIAITSLIGIGDIDGGQFTGVYNATSILRGNKVIADNNNNYLGSRNIDGGDPTDGLDPKYQSWFIVPKSSKFEYIFGVPHFDDNQINFYFNMIGGIPLPIKKTPPTLPSISYHLDSELLCTLFYILFIFKLYF